MKEIIEKTDKPLDYIKSYIIPVVVFICGLSVAWTVLQSNVGTNALAIEKLENKMGENERCVIETSERLIRIETQLEQVYKILDREYNGK